MNRALIMAGGEGTRLRPFTHTIPKPLLPIGRKPIAQIIIERLRRHGITDITMSLGYAADMIQAYFQDGSRFGVNLKYFVEDEKLGTAGCLGKITEFHSGEPFIVTNGDIISEVDYTDLLSAHNSNGSLITVAVRRGSFDIPYGVINTEGNQIVSVEEKPNHSYLFNAGIYAISPQAIVDCNINGKIDMTDVINFLLKKEKNVSPYELEGIWIDLARVQDFDKVLENIDLGKF